MIECNLPRKGLTSESQTRPGRGDVGLSGVVDIVITRLRCCLHRCMLTQVYTCVRFNIHVPCILLLSTFHQKKMKQNNKNRIKKIQRPENHPRTVGVSISKKTGRARLGDLGFILH